MSVFAVVAPLVFLAVTLLQLEDITSHLIDPPTLELPDYDGSVPIDVFFTSALLDLEAHTLTRRYHQINAGLLARTWVEYLGFFTGMLLACIGAVFILGKLQVEVSSASFEGGILTASLNSSSPGLVMAFFGIVLIFATILVNPRIEFNDGGAYLGRYSPGFVQTTNPPSEASSCFTQEELEEFDTLVLQTDPFTQEQAARRDELRQKRTVCETESTE